MDDKRREYFRNYQEKRKRVQVSFSPDEYQKVSYLADKNNTKVATYSLQIIQHHLEKSPFVPQQLTDDIRDIKYLLRNVASNVNQIAHKVMVDEHELLMQLKKLEDGLAEYIQNEAEK